MNTTTRTVSTPDGDMELYEATPDGTSKGAVIVVQEAWGVNSHIQDIVRRFADAGFVAVAPSFYHRAGGGVAAYGDGEAVGKLSAGLTDDAVLTDIDATFDHLAQAGFGTDRVGIVGFCFGGRVAFLAALRRSIGAAVGFYGGGIVEAGQSSNPALVDKAGALATPFLGLFGEEDPVIPPDQVNRLDSALRQAKVDHAVVSYPGAGHAFHNDERENMYNESAAADGWRKAVDWLSSRLGS